VGQAMRSIAGEVRGLMSEADLLEVAANLEPSSMAADLTSSPSAPASCIAATLNFWLPQ